MSLDTFLVGRKVPAIILVATIVCLAPLSLVTPPVLAQSVDKDKGRDKKDDKKDEKKKTEPLPIRKLTQGMGFYGIGPLSPDKQHLLFLAQKTDAAPNIYVLDITDFSIRPPLTSFKWGAVDPQWSPEGTFIALAGFDESASFSEVYTLNMKTAALKRITTNNFSDKEPSFTPDGKRLIYTTDESPLADAAFGVLHIASVPIGGGKPEYFTEDEVSTVQPAIPDAQSVLLIQIDEHSGRHELWQYGLDGKPQRSLTERKFARIQRYIPNAATETIIIWGQEEVEQQDGIYILNLKTRELRELPNPDLPKRNPAVSPNGKLIAFTSPTGSGLQLFVFNSGTGEIQQLTYKGVRTHSPVFVSDDKIIFGSDRDNGSELYLVDLNPPPPSDDAKKK